MTMTERDKKIYEELKEKYKDDLRAMELIEAAAKLDNPKFWEVKVAFELLY